MTNEQFASTSHYSAAWPPFAQKLAAILEKLEEDQFLILSVKRSNRFIQFAAQGSFGMRVETTSNSYLDKPEKLNEQQISTLIDAGWHDPTGTPSESTPDGDPDGSPNFFVEFSAPISFEVVANLTVRTLAEILRVPHPGSLQYEAFDEDGEAIVLPELGLKIAKRAPRADNPEDLSRLLLATLKETTGISDLNYDGDDKEFWELFEKRGAEFDKKYPPGIPLTPEQEKELGVRDVTNEHNGLGIIIGIGKSPTTGKAS